MWRTVLSTAEEEAGMKRARARSFQHGKQWKAKDLHAMNGDIVLAEYVSHQRPTPSLLFAHVSDPHSGHLLC